MNKTILIGRLAQDPQSKKINDSKLLVTFTVVVNVINGKPLEKPDYIPCIAWEKTGENIAKNVIQGKRIMVEGPLKIDRYKDHEQKWRYDPKIVVEYVEFLSEKGDSNNSKASAENDSEYLLD